MIKLFKEKFKSLSLEKLGNFFTRIPESWRQVILIFMTVRILASLAAAVGYTTVPANAIVPAENYFKQPYSKTFEIFAGVWERSDALWYLHIARDGYRRKTKAAAFMPLYPLTIRGVRMITSLPYLLCALLVSNICLIVALYFIYCITSEEKDADTASRTIWYQALFPGSLFFLAPYTESLFLALASGTFLVARKRKWWLACLLAGLLGATRIIGILILFPLLVEFIRQRKEKIIVPLRQAFWFFLVPLGLMAVMIFWKLKSGDPLAFVHRQSAWERIFIPPWITLWEGFRQAMQISTDATGGIYILEALTVGGAIIIGILAFCSLPLPYTLFLWLGLLPPLMNPFPGRMFMSCMRFVAVLFPIFMTLGAKVKNPEIVMAIRIIFAGFFGLSTALYVASQNMF